MNLIIILAASFEWDEANGAETPEHDVNSVNWKNEDSFTESAANYQANPIVAGTNSFDKFQYGHIFGTYSMIEAGIYSHTGGAVHAQMTLFGVPLMDSDTADIAYRTPAITTNGDISVDMSAILAIGSGRAVWFGITSPTAATKEASSTAGPPLFTNYLATQVATTGTMPAGEITQIQVTLRYDES